MQLTRARHLFGGRGRVPAERPAPAATACGAPLASMYFAPDGSVRACCVNTGYTLGRIGEQSIREIWEGARIGALRSALSNHDFSLGCEDCEHRIAAGDRRWSTAEQYDPYLHDAPGRYPRRMDFVLSITCNLQCAMCNGDLSSSIRMHREHRAPMPAAYGDEFFEELREFLPHLERSVFLGGEPFVARESQRVWDLMLELGLDAPVQVVSNGTQWNPRVERYLRELPMSVAMSIDGITAATLESLRVGVERDALFANVDRYQEAVESHGGTVSFHFCLMRQNVMEFGEFLLEADRRGITTIVMTVTGPDGFSLWDLPAGELREVLGALEREHDRIADRLERNRVVWDAELARIRRHLSALSDGSLPAWVAEPSMGTPVEVVRAAPGSDTDSAIERAPSPADSREPYERALATWSGREPLIVDTRDAVVGTVHPVDWALPLEPAKWVGVALTDISDLVSTRLGVAGTSTLTEHPHSVVESETRFGTAADAVTVRTVASPTGVAGGMRIAIATDASTDLLSGAGQ